MRQLLTSIHDAILDLWSHRLTAAIGGSVSVAAVANLLDLLTKIGGLAAVLVAIYCSLARNAREERAHQLQAKPGEPKPR